MAKHAVLAYVTQIEAAASGDGLAEGTHYLLPLLFLLLPSPRFQKEEGSRTEEEV